MTEKYEQYPLVLKALNAPAPAIPAADDDEDDFRPSAREQALLVDRALEIVETYVDSTADEKETVMTAIVLLTRGFVTEETASDFTSFEADYSPQVRKVFESAGELLESRGNMGDETFAHLGQMQCAVILAQIQLITEKVKKGLLPQGCSSPAELEDTVGCCGMMMQNFFPMAQSTAPRLEQLFKDTAEECLKAIEDFKPAPRKFKSAGPKP